MDLLFCCTLCPGSGLSHVLENTLALPQLYKLLPGLQLTLALFF